jgi:hypothetical protein
MRHAIQSRLDTAPGSHLQALRIDASQFSNPIALSRDTLNGNETPRLKEALGEVVDAHAVRRARDGLLALANKLVRAGAVLFSDEALDVRAQPRRAG